MFARLGVAVEIDHYNLMAACKPLDQSQQNRDHANFAGVDSAGDD